MSERTPTLTEPCDTLNPHPVWVPVRRLGARHFDLVRAHLIGLDAHDRYLRFGHGASDDYIDRYVRHIDFERDVVFGAFDRHLELVAVGHLAPCPAFADARPAAEFGVSVSPGQRRRGFGARLFGHAMLLARNRGLERLVIHALRENAAMLAIARQAGAAVVSDGPDAQAWLELPGPDWGSHLEQWAEARAAWVDYTIKARAHHRSQLDTPNVHGGRQVLETHDEHAPRA